MLRDYQVDLKRRINEAWAAGHRNVIATMATGGGKTVVQCEILREHDAPAVVMAHRSELVSQMALALNRENIPHAVIAPKPIIQQIVKLEIDTHGYSRWSSQAPIRVASAHTLAIRDAKDRWYGQCSLALVDEGHHVTRDSVWDRALQLVPNAKGLFKTAHAVRADGAGLGRHADGLADVLVIGPCGRNLIDRGYLCDYRIVCPPSDIDVSDVPIGSSGDFSHDKLREAVHRSRTIVGDTVSHYLRFAAGKLGLTFAVDVEAAHELRAAYEKAGVPAEVITAKTPIATRAAVMRRFRARQLLQLVSVDVLSEGVDVPAVEVVSLDRHTASFQLFAQQIGRALRVSAPITDSMTDDERKACIAASGKPRAIIIDHVDNVRRHYLLRGMFDSPQQYTLDRRERKAKPPKGIIPLRTCLNGGEDDGKTPGIPCFQPYEAHLLACPYCGTERPSPSRRSTPEEVEGDLVELDPATLASMRGEIARIDGPPTLPIHAGPAAVAGNRKHHTERQAAQHTLRGAIALWAGLHKHRGSLEDRAIHKLFWYHYGVDIMTAQTLGAREAAELELTIRTALSAAGVTQV